LLWRNGFARKFSCSQPLDESEGEANSRSMDFQRELVTRLGFSAKNVHCDPLQATGISVHQSPSVVVSA
jgi:hypothetical protein